MKIFNFELLKDFFSYGLIGVLGKAINIFVIPFYVHYLTVEEFGILEIFASSIAIFTLISTFQLDTAFLRFFSELKNKNEIDSYFSTALNSLFLILIPVTFLSFFILRPFFSSLDLNVFFMFLFIIPIKSLLSYLTCLFRVTFNRNHFVKINLINIVCIPLFSLLLLYYGFGINAIIYSTLIFNFISLLTTYYLIFENHVFIIDFDILKEMFKFSAPLIPASLSIVLFQNVSKFFIFSYISLTVLGFYSFALKVFIPFSIIVQSLKMAWYPRAYQIFDKLSDSNKMFLKVERYFSFLVLSIYFLLISLSKSLIDLFGDGKMNTSKDYVVLISLVFLTRSLAYFYIVSLNILKRTTWVMKINVLSLLLLSLCFLILYLSNRISIYNIIICEIFTELIRLLIITYLTKKYFQKFYTFHVIIILLCIIFFNLLFFI